MEQKIGAAIGETLAAREEEERRELPRRKRLEAMRAATPRVIVRDPGDSWYGPAKVTYAAQRLGDVGYLPARTETYFSLDEPRKKKTKRRAAVVHTKIGSGGRAIRPEQLGEFVRRPTAKALRRLEEAEEALRLARRAVVDAERAAFTYGKPVTLAAVQDVTRRRAKIYDETREE